MVNNSDATSFQHYPIKSISDEFKLDSISDEFHSNDGNDEYTDDWCSNQCC